MAKPQTPTDAVSFMAYVGSAQAAKPEGFEGPEKRLEVIVRKTEAAPSNGIRAAPQHEWETIIDTLNAKIVSAIHNDFVDSFVLTESSLFVFSDRVILITCGTTTLLTSLPLVIELIKRYGCEVEWASFMRKNYSYPWEQVGPHTSMKEEYDLLKGCLPLGKPFIFGPIDSDHYFFFVYDDIKRPCVENEIQISMTMYDFDDTVAKQFFSEEFSSTSDLTQRIRDSTGLSTLVDGWQIQDLQFAPCGYSINAIQDGSYQTMHITPESHCSFASYETNSPLDNLTERLTAVLKVFMPKRFTVIVVADPESSIGKSIASSQTFGLDALAGYSSSNSTMNEFAKGYIVLKSNFVAS
jgi:S-adenosylmethionine decarboxylase